MLDKTASSATYQGGDGIAVFPIPFPFLETSHLQASLRDGDGNIELLSSGKDYAVNRVSDSYGEFILLERTLAADHELTIARVVPLTQEIMFHNQGPNSPRAVEEAADKLTMIAQQLQAGIDQCLTVPDGSTAEEVQEILIGTSEALASLRGQIHTLGDSLAKKSSIGHSHAVAEVSGLDTCLAAKADAQTVTNVLAAKADASQLQGKANTQHVHAVADVTGLAAALSGKVDTTDPRLGQSTAPASHAASHAAGGSDPIRPEDIGTLAAPPSDGKSYLAAAGGWIEYVAPSGGGDGGGGTADHAQLLNRDVADQHPQSAIRNLASDLDVIRGNITALNGTAQTLADSVSALEESASAVPENGQADDLLACGSGGTPNWKTPAQIAETMPLMSYARRGMAKISSDRGLELDAEGRLGIAAANLVSKEEIELVADNLEDLLDSLGTLARVDDAPSTGKPYARQNGEWKEITASSSFGGGSGGAAIAGEIRLLPFRSSELPSGWYFCNGDRYQLTSTQGGALNSLSDAMKTDWGITASNGTIGLPNLFSNGSGYFLRPVDNATRFPGNCQSDAIRNITGSYAMMSTSGMVRVGTSSDAILSGAFVAGTATKTLGPNTTSVGASKVADLLFDASECVPTAAENRPMNIGVTPAIYLGV